MKRVKRLFLALSLPSLIAASVMTTPALAFDLPDMHVLSGDTYPVTGENVLKGAEIVVFETELGEKIVAGEIERKLTLKELSSKGFLTIDLRKATEPKAKLECNTKGDAAGIILITADFDLVVVSMFPLVPAVLLLFPELTFECGNMKIKARAPVLLGLTKAEAGLDTEGIGFTLKCTPKGKQELKEYLND
ncbi:MAG TPA: hypothetical protein VMB05_15880, partial [Solirubrobacteraceae bacterium]|nr:hypothetical protein [Solirubrobacteraceae bacterium]